jgi:hypothetical protein
MLKRLRGLISGKSQEEQETQPIPEGVELERTPQSLLRPETETSTKDTPTPTGEQVTPAPPEGSTEAATENPEAYLARVQAKINKLAEEFATGAINQRQFQELYEHYQKEQQTVKRWLAMAPDTDAWQEATTEGQSVLIRADNLARVVGYAIYESNSGMPLNTIGQFEVDPELVVPMLSSYRAATQEIFGAGMRSSEIEGGRWLCFVPGEFTTLMALFSKGPSTRQLNSLEELHRLFERANRYFLQDPNLQPGDLVFPHTHFIGRMD